MRGLRTRLLFGFLLLGCVALIGRTDALAATHADVVVNPPDRLLRGIVMIEPAGTYRQVVQLTGDVLSTDLMFTLPASGLIEEPGPVVALWQYEINVADAQFFDTMSWLAGPPQEEVVLPNCDASGSCDLHFRVSGPIGEAFAAAEVDGVGRTSVTVLMSVVLTYSAGAQLQVIAPEAAVDSSDGGTLNDPAPIDGVSVSSTVLVAADASSAEIPPVGLGQGEQQYDWGVAVTEALEDLPSSPPPESPGSFRLLVTAAVAALLVVFGAAAVALRRRRGTPRQEASPGSPAER